MAIPASAPILVALGLVFGAGGEKVEAQLAGPLPRSSIAAVLAHQGELELSAEQVKELEKRDEALQKELAAIRDRHGTTPAASRAPQRGPGRTEGASPGAIPGSTSGDRSAGGGAHGMGGGHAGHPPRVRSPSGDPDPTTRAAALQRELDDADTHAWLGAETTLPVAKQQRARSIAARYREDLSDQREKATGKGAP
jgi:hypothetical protein